MKNTLEAYFDAAFAAPQGIKRLRELILTLAVQGKLVEQNPADEPACELLKKIAAEKAAIAAYTNLIDRICDDDIRQILERIIKDEEHHIKLFTELLEGLSSNNCCR